MGFKNSPGCGCCGETGPCCVQAKRYFMDREGHASVEVSSGPSGGPYTNYQAQENACVGSSAMSGNAFPAFDLSGTISSEIIRNDLLCRFDAENATADTGGLYGIDAWEVGAGRITEKQCVSFPVPQLQYLGLTDFGSAGPAISVAADLNYYCDAGDYHYRLLVQAVASYKWNNLPYTFPASGGVDWTSTSQVFPNGTTLTTYSRNSGNATVQVSSGGGFLGVISRTWVDDLTTVTLWVPNPLVDPLGLTESAVADIT